MRRCSASHMGVRVRVRVLGFRGEGDRAAEPVENQRGEAPVGTEGRVERSPWLGLYNASFFYVWLCGDYSQKRAT